MLQDMIAVGDAVADRYVQRIRNPFQVRSQASAPWPCTRTTMIARSRCPTRLAEIVQGLKLDATFLQGRDQMAIIDGRVYSKGRAPAHRWRFRQVFRDADRGQHPAGEGHPARRMIKIMCSVIPTSSAAGRTRRGFEITGNGDGGDRCGRPARSVPETAERAARRTGQEHDRQPGRIILSRWFRVAITPFRRSRVANTATPAGNP